MILKFFTSIRNNGIQLCSKNNFPLLKQVRNYKKHSGHKLQVNDGQIFAKTINVNKKLNLLSAYLRLTKQMKVEKFFSQVSRGAFFERPTDKRKRIRNEFRFKRFIEYARGQSRAAGIYYSREKNTAKYKNSI